MDFSDEPYVRLYTRKTLTHRLLGWEGRVVMRMMLDEFDPAGIFAIRGDAAVCIAAMTELPVEIVRVGLQRLIETETWIVTERSITWPTYEEAQNCTRSDRLRKRESRRARSLQSVTNVTSGHSDPPDDGTNVPERPIESQDVTLPPSLPPILPPTLRKGDPRARGVARTYELPTADPPKEYLDAADMAGVSSEQARSTWEWYFAKGLPPDGVQRPIPWLVKQAKARANQVTTVARGSPRRRGSAQRDHGLTGWE